MTHLFSSHYSLNSILTLDKSDEIKDDKPVSICAIAKHHKLESVTLCEKRLSGFVEAYKNLPCAFQFGWRCILCEDVENKTDESNKTQHKMVVFAKNTDGYFDLLRLHNFATTQGYFERPRLDCKVLKRLWTKNLALMVPFYDSFLHMNNFTFSSCFADLAGLEPVFGLETHDLPIDSMLRQIVVDYAGKNGFDTEEVNTCLYYRPEDFTAWVVYRCITQPSFGKRRSLAAPELPGCCSDSFCYLRNDT